MSHPKLIALAAASVLTACATPQPALDQANATAALVTRFDGELAAYRKTAAQVAGARVQSIRRQEALIAELDEIDTWNRRTAELAGLGEIEARRRSLAALAESRAADDAATKQRLAELDARLAALVQPLPSASAKLAVLKQALAEMGTELSAGERLNLVLAAVQTVLDEVKKNRDAAADAVNNTKAAPVPTPPTQEQP